MEKFQEQQNNPNRLRGIIAVAGLVLGGMAVNACNVKETNLPPETVLARNGDIDITAGEYDIIVDAADRWDLPAGRLGKLALCESGMSASADNGGHAGPFQQAKSYWAKRLAEYNSATGERLSGNIKNFEANTRVSAKMINDKRTSKYSTTHNGLPTDWVQCQAGWDGKNNKSSLWDAATLQIYRLQAEKKLNQ